MADGKFTLVPGRTEDDPPQLRLQVTSDHEGVFAALDGGALCLVDEELSHGDPYIKVFDVPADLGPTVVNQLHPFGVLEADDLNAGQAKKVLDAAEVQIPDGAKRDDLIALVKGLFVMLLAVLVIGCSSPGRRTAANASACSGEAKEANAAAAAADGGMKALNAPFSGETGWRADASSTIGSGAGDTSSSRDGNVEQRETASGGAQNVAVNVPTEAWAKAGGSGGMSASVVSAQQVVTMYQAALQLAIAQQADPEQIRFLSEKLGEAQRSLALAEAGTRMTINVNYHQDHQTNTLFGVSSSSTDGRPNEQAVREAAAGMSALAREAAASRAPAAADAPSAPPAGGN